SPRPTVWAPTYPGRLCRGRDVPRHRGARTGRRVGRRGRARFAAFTPLVAVALDLNGQLLGAQVDRVHQVGRSIARAKRDALEMERGLGDLRIGDGRVALLENLDLELSQLRHLPGDLSEALVYVLPQVL